MLFCALNDELNIIYNHKNIYIIKTKIIYYALFIQFNKFDIFYFYIYFTNANV